MLPPSKERGPGLAPASPQLEGEAPIPHSPPAPTVQPVVLVLLRADVALLGPMDPGPEEGGAAAHEITGGARIQLPTCRAGGGVGGKLHLPAQIIPSTAPPNGIPSAPHSSLPMRSPVKGSWGL